MANVTDLKTASEDLLPIVKELFRLADRNSDIQDKTREHAVVNRLNKLLADSNTPTKASMTERAETIVAARTALSEVLVQAASRDDMIPETTLRTVRAQRTTLRSTFSNLLKLTAFNDIPQLLTQDEIDSIERQLEGADEEINQRQNARDILQAIISVAINGAEIATKLA